MSEPEYVLVGQSVDEVPAAIGTLRERSGRRRALEYALVPFGALRRRRRRVVMAMLLVVGAAGLAAAVVAVRRRNKAPVRTENPRGVTEDSAEDLELRAHAASD